MNAPEKIWRPMQPSDLTPINAIAEQVHTNHPEDAAVATERLKLSPAGCHVLSERGGDTIYGYLVSHPWFGDAPKLNSLLQNIPPNADHFYLHDLCLLPQVRRMGLASIIAAHILSHAKTKQYSKACLISVNGTEGFWKKHGFENIAVNEDVLRSYGDDARYMMCDLSGSQR